MADILNHLTLTGVILKMEPVRYTPSGLALIDLKLEHRSIQEDADMKRPISMEIMAVLSGDLTKKAEILVVGLTIHASGFLALRGAHYKQVVFHIQQLEMNASSFL